MKKSSTYESHKIYFWILRDKFDFFHEFNLNLNKIVYSKDKRNQCFMKSFNFISFLIDFFWTAWFLILIREVDAEVDFYSFYFLENVRSKFEFWFKIDEI
jgi:hypothetical protein